MHPTDPSCVLGDEPPLPPGWEWRFSAVDSTSRLLVVPTDLAQRPRWVQVHVDGYEAPNGAFVLTFRMGVADRTELNNAVAGALWGLDTFVPTTSDRKTLRTERQWTWLKLGLHGFWRWFRTSLAWWNKIGRSRGL